MFNTAMKNKL